jgi:hypothetical protein
MEEGVNDIAFWPDEAAELGERLFTAVEAVDVIGRWFADDDAVQFFNVISEAFEDRKMVIDDGVGERVGEVVRSAFSDQAACVTESFSDGVKRVSQGFLLNA